MPEWLGQAVTAAVAGVLGFVGKGLIDHIRARRTLRRTAFDELRSLRNLLEESQSVFRSHNYQARRLMSLLRGRLGEQVPKGLGFDETFYRLYDEMIAEERELHSIVRATTMNSMRRLNEELQAWLERNTQFNESAGSSARRTLAEKLKELKLHLNQWLDKYAAVIPEDERRSLVYLADEKKHGVGFPKHLSDAVEEVISEY